MKMINLSERKVLPELKTILPSKDKLCITTQKGHHIINKNDISHLEADSNYTTIYFQGESVVVSQTVSRIVEKINLPQFLRIHKSYVINLDQIRLINNSFSSVTTDCGNMLPISRAKKSMVKAAVMKRFDQ